MHTDIKRNSGFTMVEIIIATIILAIVIAIAVPVTLSIINTSRESDAKLMAKNIMNAVQTEFNQLASNNELWTSNGGRMGIILNKNRKARGSTIDGYNSSGEFKSGFINISDTVPVDNIFKRIDNSEDIYMLYVGAGNVYQYYKTEETEKMYTAYVIVFQLKDGNQPIYFYNGKEISTEWPFSNPTLNKNTTNFNNHNGQNFFLKNNAVKLQLYALKITCNDNSNKICDNYWKNIIMPIVKNQQ